MTVYAGQYGPETLTDTTGRPAPTALVQLYLPGTSTPATVYGSHDRAVPLASNPVPAGVPVNSPGLDIYANLTFFADPGKYDLVTTVSGKTLRQTVTVNEDPAEPEAGSTTGAAGPTGPAPFTAPVVYNPATAYHPLSGLTPADSVNYLGSTYVAVGASTGVAPGSDATKWALLASKGDPGGGSGGGSGGPAQAVIFAGATAAGAVFQAGVGYSSPTTVTSILVVCKTAPSGAATLVDWYVQGPGTGNALSSIKATTTIPAGSYQSSPVSTSIAVQAYDSLVPKVRTVGSTPAGDVTAYITDNSSIVPATQPYAPTNVTATVAGQANGAAQVTWTPTAAPPGQTVTSQTVTSSTGVAQTVAAGVSTYTFNGLPSASVTFTVTETTDLGGSSPPSAASNAVTPTSSSQRLTTAEQQGQNWSADNNCSVAYDGAVTPSGSQAGLTGSLKVIATAAASAEAILTRHVPVTANEANKPLSAIFRNDTNVAISYGIWVVYFDSSGAYAASSAVLQQIIAAGATGTISTTATAPASAATGSVLAQGVATAANQQYHVGSVSWG